MRVLAGIVVALICVTAAILYAALNASRLPPSPLVEIAKPAPAPQMDAQTDAGIPHKEIASAPAVPPTPEPVAEPAPDPAPRPENEQGSETALEPVRRDIRNVTPDRVLPGPDIAERMIERLPAVVPPPPPPRPEEPERWRRALVVAPGVLKSGGKQIVIAGIDPLGGETECNAADGTAWPCGKFASAALRRLVRQRPVECDPVEIQVAARGGTQGDSTAETLEQRLSATLERAPANDGGIVTRCKIAGRDIGEWMVEQGWASPQPGSGYDEALAKAREAGRGQWRRKAIAGLPQSGLPSAATIQAATEAGPLLAPGMSASDALVPLPETAALPAEPATVESLPQTPAKPVERGGLDR
ncbi:MAG: hypothetical protein KDJ90_08165 [Nitratireductor sp.]|nr:hypothetical protein [Nitratireductor sp.]